MSDDWFGGPAVDDGPRSVPARGAELLGFTGHLYRRAQQLHAAVWLREVSSEITSVQFAALVVIDGHPDASQRDLGRALDLDRSTIADLVARMSRRDLIDRTRHPTDRRRNVLRLTAGGHAELALLRPRVEAIESALTTGLSGPERVELRRLLRVVLERVASSDPVTEPVSPDPVVEAEASPVAATITPPSVR